MSKRSVFTTVTPLPAGITRDTVMETLRSHVEMIDLNPLVEERHPIKPPPNASAEEYHCQWYSLTDRVQYVPGGLISGRVSYTCCFHDLDNGLQTHCYAPMGLNIRGKWTVGGSLPGEPVAPVELGANVPLHGLWLREDVDMKCNIMMTSFVKKTLKKSHASLVDRLVVKAQLLDASLKNARLTERSLSSPERATPQTSTSQFSSQAPTTYSPISDYDGESIYPEEALMSPQYATFGMRNVIVQTPKLYPPLTLQNPQLQVSQVHPALRSGQPRPPRPENPEYDEKPEKHDSLPYPQQLNERRDSGQSWHDSIHGGSNGPTSLRKPVDGTQDSNNRARVTSWQQNLSTSNVQNSHRSLDPGFQGSHYRSTSSYSACRNSGPVSEVREWDRRGANLGMGTRVASTPPPAYQSTFTAELEG